MNSLFDPASNTFLLALKRIALNGGDRGPLYDQGILSVIRQIEETGSYVPTTLLPLIEMYKRPERAKVMFSIAEREELLDILRQKGWTLAEGAQFASGVWQAEVELQVYRKK